YRATLVAVLACPIVTWLISTLGLTAALGWLPTFRPIVVQAAPPAPSATPADVESSSQPNVAASSLTPTPDSPLGPADFAATLGHGPFRDPHATNPMAPGSAGGWDGTGSAPVMARSPEGAIAATEGLPSPAATSSASASPWIIHPAATIFAVAVTAIW